MPVLTGPVLIPRTSLCVRNQQLKVPCCSRSKPTASRCLYHTDPAAGRACSHGQSRRNSRPRGLLRTGTDPLVLPLFARTHDPHARSIGAPQRHISRHSSSIIRACSCCCTQTCCCCRRLASRCDFLFSFVQARCRRLLALLLFLVWDVYTHAHAHVHFEGACIYMGQLVAYD